MVKFCKHWSKSMALIMFVSTVGEPYPLPPWFGGEESVGHNHTPGHQRTTIQKESELSVTANLHKKLMFGLRTEEHPTTPVPLCQRTIHPREVQWGQNTQGAIAAQPETSFGIFLELQIWVEMRDLNGASREKFNTHLHTQLCRIVQRTNQGFL